MDNNESQINKQFLKFKGKEVIVTNKNGDEYDGTLIAIDNYLNLVLEKEGKLRALKGGKILYIALKD